MRELDVLLVAYLERRYEQAPDEEKAAFCALLELPDPELMAYLLQSEQPAAEFADVIDAILDRTGH
ncbi:MAG: succinate dehydrogenase assembly factor 2 [Gammaproteobacteria bacterium]|nr:succinate dehydrogenase assembly factor 2 [Gammaproteobacteria bacterium]